MARRAAAAEVQHLTPLDLATRLRLDEQTLYDWRKTGKGPAYIRGESDGAKATIRYPLAEVEAWEKRRLVMPTAGT